VPVTGVDGGGAFFDRADEVQGVGGTEERRGWEGSKSLRGQAEKRVVQSVPAREATGAVGLELISEHVKASRINNAFSEFSVEAGDNLRLARQDAADAEAALGKSDDVRAVRLCEVDLRKIAGVKIDPCPSRISEMISVLSVPPRRPA